MSWDEVTYMDLEASLPLKKDPGKTQLRGKGDKSSPLASGRLEAWLSLADRRL